METQLGVSPDVDVKLSAWDILVTKHHPKHNEFVIKIENIQSRKYLWSVKGKQTSGDLGCTHLRVKMRSRCFFLVTIHEFDLAIPLLHIGSRAARRRGTVGISTFSMD
ncbi:uncharacterized protein PHALS_06316 [Plasmopara halstedii]|uniref:Uncharacterized protein n=1 Tax=Plasmopara halstedii TaxID=4781 RepID=A0A0P1B4F4_PLAHL|nr:uncharacterized protein PHALS_06316 [Plasmopara halstedii]CEG48497.1 hypothetical protein PHALS_06316 [Plasmopara halstedii]|eukprot:XP_024584866.1 hypothetical protein PHALS_06316 [Plasmopara halstedii]